MNKERIFVYLDRTIIAFLCIVIFCLPFSKAGIESFIWPAIFLWILKRVLGYRADSFWGLLPNSGLNKALGIFVMANMFSVVISSNLGLSLRGFFGKDMKFLILYFMMIEVINSKKRLKVVLITIIASVVLIVLDAGVQFFRGVDFLRGYPWRTLTASFVSPTGFASWLVVIIPLCLGVIVAMKNSNRSFKVFLSILILMLIICLMATYTRGAWIGIIVGFSLIFGYIIKSFNSKVKLMFLIGGLGVIIIFFILPQSLRSKITSVGRVNFKSVGTVNARIKSMLKVEEGGSILVRLRLWDEALKIYDDYPMFGCGLNTYSMVAKNYKSFNGGGIYPHNSFLHMLVETGIYGLTAFIWVLFNFFKIGLSYLNRRMNYLVLGILSGLLSFLIHSFFDTHLYSLQLVILFWYMLGLTIVIIKLDIDHI